MFIIYLAGWPRHPGPADRLLTPWRANTAWARILANRSTGKSYTKSALPSSSVIMSFRPLCLPTSVSSRPLYPPDRYILPTIMSSDHDVLPTIMSSDHYVLPTIMSSRTLCPPDHYVFRPLCLPTIMSSR